VAEYGASLRSLLAAWVAEQPSRPAALYTHHLAALANNAGKYSALAQEARASWWRPGLLASQPSHPDSPGSFEQLLQEYRALGQDAVSALLGEATAIIEAGFGQFFTEPWLTGSVEAVGAICGRLNNSFESYHRLGEAAFQRLHLSVETRLAARYITAMLQQGRAKVVLGDEVDRRAARERVREDVEHFREFLAAVAGGRLEAGESPFTTVELLAEVVGAEEDLLSLEVISLASKHSDLTEEQLVCLLAWRGLPRPEARQLAAETLEDSREAAGPLRAGSVLGMVTLSTGLLDRLLKS
jgi:hypothetical protein